MPRQGFTLIEIAIAVGIAALVGAFVFSTLVTFRRSASLDAALRDGIAILRLGQARTLASESDSQYGVHFEADRMVLFRGSSYMAGAATNEVTVVPAPVVIGPITLSGGGQDVIFDRLSGRTSQSGSVSFSAGSEVRVLTIEASGEVRPEIGLLPPSGSRVSDTRHMNFTLGWSIQNASLLRLTFMDPPAPNVVRDVALSNICTNSPWTACDWEEVSDVYGASQALRVHTVSLSATNTTLSIHRERSSNSKAVTISVVDGGIPKDVASYTAAGTTTVGIYGGTMVAQ